MLDNPRKTPLQSAFDTLLVRIAELRAHDACGSAVFDDSVPDLQDIADLLKQVTAAFDPLLHRIAQAAGVGKVGEFASIATNATEGDLWFAITDKAARLKDDDNRPRRRREHSTLNHAQQGI